MRTIKEHDERKNEILDVAERLFHADGYERSTVNQILKAVGIAKGTFYHYFQSKEEVLDGVVERHVRFIRERADQVLASDAPPEDRMVRAIQAMRITQEEGADVVLDELHRSQNALLHQKTLNAVISCMAPVLATIAEQGNERGTWRCEHPLRAMRIFLAAGITITDEGIFAFTEAEQQDLLQGLVELLGKLLGAPAGALEEAFARNADAGGRRS